MNWVKMPVAAVVNEFANIALVELGEPLQGIERRLVSGFWPRLPVRNVLVGDARATSGCSPAFIPSSGHLGLRQAMSHPHSNASVDVLFMRDERGDLRPRPTVCPHSATSAASRARRLR